MKKITLLRSLRDFASSKAEQLCPKDNPHFEQLVDVYETVVRDEIVNDAIEWENAYRVEPVLSAFFRNQSEIPIPFYVNEKQVVKIKVSNCWLDVTTDDNDVWYHLSSGEKVRLYEALVNAGYLDILE